MVNYKDLGLVNTRDMFAKAIKGGYAIPAFNFNNMEQMQAIIKACLLYTSFQRQYPDRSGDHSDVVQAVYRSLRRFSHQNIQLLQR